MKSFVYFAFVFAIFSCISYPVVSWSCPGRNAVQGGDLFPNLFDKDCPLSHGGKCIIGEAASKEFYVESEIPAPCAELGDFLMFCTSFYPNYVTEETTASLGFFDDSEEVTGFKKSSFTRFCVPTVPCGNNVTSNILYMGVKNFEGSLSISALDTVVSRPKIVPFSLKGVADTKMGKLIPAETLGTDGSYKYIFNVRTMETYERFSQALGRIEAINASLHIKNAIRVPSGAYVQFNHCDQLKHIDPEGNAVISVIHARGNSIAPVLLQSSKDGVNWTTFAEIDTGGKEEISRSLPDPTQCHIRYAYESEPSEFGDLNAWNLIQYSIEFPSTEKPSTEVSGAQVAYYQGYQYYNATIDFTPEFIEEPFEYEVRRGAKFTFPVVFQADMNGYYLVSTHIDSNCGRAQVSGAYGPMEKGVPCYANVTFTMNDPSCFKFGGDFSFPIDVSLSDIPFAELIVQISGKGVFPESSSSSKTHSNSESGSSEDPSSSRPSSASYSVWNMALIALTLLFTIFLH